MRPPRVQADKDKAPAFAHGQAADRQARGLLVGPTRAGFPGNDLFAALCADCAFCQMILKAFRAAPRAFALHPRKVVLGDAPIMSRQRIRKAAYGGIRLADEQQAGGIPIQTVYRSGDKRRSGKRRFKPCSQAVRVSRARMYGQAGRLAEHDDVSRLRNDGGQFLAARRRGNAFRFRSGPGKGRNPDFIVQFHPVERFGPPAVDPDLPGTDPAVQDALRLFETPGQELQQLLPGFRRRHLQWFRHGIPLKNTASPPAEGELHVLRVAVPAQERLRADFHAARKPESPARNASDGREIGQGIRSARAHDRNRSDARLQTLWRMRASLTRRRPFREKEYSPCSLSCPFPF